jgi:hypothetical protein
MNTNFDELLIQAEQKVGCEVLAEHITTSTARFCAKTMKGTKRQDLQSSMGKGCLKPPPPERPASADWYLSTPIHFRGFFPRIGM